jgi:hypothetical protein
LTTTLDDDLDPDHLIARLAAPLAPGVRQAFRRAAEAALAQLPGCVGAGVIYRTVAPLQRAYLDPPADGHVGFDIGPDSLGRQTPARDRHRPPG